MKTDIETEQEQAATMVLPTYMAALTGVARFVAEGETLTAIYTDGEAESCHHPSLAGEIIKAAKGKGECPDAIELVSAVQKHRK